MDINPFNHDLLAYLAASTTPFHAVEQMAIRLQAAGFIQLQESDHWQLKPTGRYYVIRNGSSIVAFNLTKSDLVKNGIRMIGAHTDSPCLKLKPHPEIHKKGYFQLGVEVYGGALLNPWFDRDLSLAGRLSYKRTDGTIGSALIDFQRPIACIPSLAIHLDRDANKNRTVNPQTDIPPILMRAGKNIIDFRGRLKEQLLIEHPNCLVQQVLDYELSFYDCQPAALVGLEQEFIAGARLDNLLSCYIGMQSLIASQGQNSLLVCTDHEEVGSQSAAGAQGPLLKSIVSRLVDHSIDFDRAMNSSMMISADNAHGVHPNFTDRHDANHGPLLNEGPVIKMNANQRYASDSETSALFRHWCESESLPVQTFVVRTDMACGSTIGPITASELGVKTLDVGVPTFAMHSIRELAGSTDAHALYQVLKKFVNEAKVTVT